MPSLKYWWGAIPTLILGAVIAALVVVAVSHADNLVSDGDGVAPVSQNNVAFGNVCVGQTYTDTALLAIRRTQAEPDTGANATANNNRVFNDGATITITLAVPPDDSADITETITDNTIVLPSDWESLALNTMSSDTGEVSISLTPSGTGAVSAAVDLRATGRNRIDTANITSNNQLRVTWTGIVCDSDPPAVTHSVGTPSYTSGPNTYVTSATTLNFNVNEVAHGNSGLSSCTVSVDGPGANDNSFPCTEGNNNYTLSTSAPLSLPSAPDGSYGNSASATDNPGNNGTDSFTVILDNTAPAFDPCSGGPFLLGSGGGSQAVSIGASDSGSGLDVGGSTLSGNVDTTTVGTKTANYEAKDNLGNTANKSCDYAVIYDFHGFFSPVDNLPTFNVAKAGQGIPVKFDLSGNQGLNIFAAGYPKSFVVSCASAADLDSIESTVTAGSSGLNYDSASNQYNYVWKTEKSWAGTCRQFDLKLIDGTTHSARFWFTK